MPSLEAARRISSAKNNGAKTLGQIRKEESDWCMEQSWNNDIQSRKCFIYDYFHDDFIPYFESEYDVTPKYYYTLSEGMTYENTSKTCIDAKFIIKGYQSIDKDQIEYYLQFKPSQKTHFNEDDELYYFETDYRSKYHNDNFIGLYCDISDDEGIYHKWIILKKEIANQFVKYMILPVNYEFMWIERNGQEKIKRRMWAILRNQNSYNSGLWTDMRFTSQENQNKILLPLNSITEKLWYTNDNTANMRVLVGARTDNPVAWTISKIENANPMGLQTITLYQDFFNQHRDFIEKDNSGNIIGMWADYYDYTTVPSDPIVSEPKSVYGKIESSTPSIKIGGSCKTLTLKIFNGVTEVTENYSNAIFSWTCFVDGEDYTEKITWRDVTKFNQKKIKFSDDRKYLNKILTVNCKIEDENGVIEVYENFDIII